MAWVRGPRCDWDDWAEMVDDEWWKWDGVLPIMKDFETSRPECPAGMEKFYAPEEGKHGSAGPFAIGTGNVWQDLVPKMLAAGQEVGYRLNKDHNSGVSEGLAVAQMNVDNGVRTTSATAFLGSHAREKLTNLTVLTKTICTRIMFDDSRRVSGVRLTHATKSSSQVITVKANQEVLLCAGAFASPQILLLSGIGPKEHLDQIEIPQVAELPVGQNMQDHSCFSLECIIDPSIQGHNQLLNDEFALERAKKDYSESKSGPLSVFGASAAVIFPRLPSLYETQAFKALPQDKQKYLSNPLRPSTEVWCHGGPLLYLGPCPTNASVLVVEALCQNNLSRGTVRLKSRDPRELPVIDPGYLTDETGYDMQIAIASLRELLKMAHAPTTQAIFRSVLMGPLDPKDEGSFASPDPAKTSDAVLEAWIKDNMTMGFHGMSTCIMGKDGDNNRVVDTEFKVLGGVKGLRVADMSVCPILTTNHTQVNAYLIGERAAELVLGDWNLSKEGMA